MFVVWYGVLYTLVGCWWWWPVPCVDKRFAVNEAAFCPNVAVCSLGIIVPIPIEKEREKKRVFIRKVKALENNSIVMSLPTLRYAAVYNAVQHVIFQSEHDTCDAPQGRRVWMNADSVNCGRKKGAAGCGKQR